MRALVLLALVACAQIPEPEATPPSAGNADRMDWWREARFGLFLHWGLYAIPAGAWGERNDHGEWIRHTAQIPVGEYERLVADFDPVRFDAEAWARMAKDAGMRYVVITSKHHDGFCLFDSALTDFDVMATPFRRDIMAELADACRRQGLRICWYHSIMDWHHPDYLPRRPWEKDDRPADGARFDRYVDYLHGQVTELLSNYGPIGVMWFDGEWEATWSHEEGVRLYELCRRLQPDVIVNNRVDVGRGGMAGMSGAGNVGDFGTPEQEVPATGLPGVDWETCMTMNRHWGWNAADDQWKSTTRLVHTLVDVASKGGNFLLNVGPRADGTFPPEAVRRLREIGGWMDRHGEAIHGTRASPFDSLDFGRCTWKPVPGGSRLYLHVLERPAGGLLVVPGLGNEVRQARLLTGNGIELAWRREGPDVLVQLPDAPIDPHCTVAELDVRGEPIVYLPPEIEAPATIFVRPLPVRLRASPELELRYTTDGSEPGADSAVYGQPISLTDTATVKVRAFHRGRAVTATVERTFTRAEPRPPVEPAPSAPGLRVTTYAGTFDELPDFARLEPEGEPRSTPVVGLPDPGPSGAREHLALVYQGFLRVPRDDVYTFALTSDDGSRLLVGGQPVVDNDGLHGARMRSGHAALGAGLHPFRVEWFNKTGGAELDLQWAPLGGELRPIPASALLQP